jgi:hypothetical protein
MTGENSCYLSLNTSTTYLSEIFCDKLKLVLLVHSCVEKSFPDYLLDHDCKNVKYSPV